MHPHSLSVSMDTPCSEILQITVLALFRILASGTKDLFMVSDMLREVVSMMWQRIEYLGHLSRIGRGSG
jgi:hypothetical protein